MVILAETGTLDLISFFHNFIVLVKTKVILIENETHTVDLRSFLFFPTI